MNHISSDNLTFQKEGVEMVMFLGCNWKILIHIDYLYLKMVVGTVTVIINNGCVKKKSNFDFETLSSNF